LYWLVLKYMEKRDAKEKALRQRLQRHMKAHAR